MQNLIETFDKIYAVDQEKIEKMSKINIAPGGKLPLPEKGEATTVFSVSSPTLETLPDGKQFGNIRVKIYNDQTDLIYDWNLSKTAWIGIRKEFKRLNMPMDQEAKCLINIPITIAGKDWKSAPQEMWQNIGGKRISPKTYNITIRDDIMKMNENKSGEISSQTDLMTF